MRASPNEHDFCLAADQQLCLVAAMDRQRGIGWQGKMPWHLPADLYHFKMLTRGHALLMGRRTWESLPRALPERHNIVLSGRVDYAAPGADVCRTMQQALQVAGSGTLMIIGGAQLFALCLPRAVRMELTLIDAQVQADTWFPRWRPAAWQVAAEHHRPVDANNAFAMTFMSLRRSVSPSPG